MPSARLLIRDPEHRFASQALLCTDLEVCPQQIIAWFVQRWQLETTFQQVRTHLGVETQRQWNDLAIERTTPALLGLFSIVTLMAHALIQDTDQKPEAIVRKAAWYIKELPTFSDAIALVRRSIWNSRLLSLKGFVLSRRNADSTKPEAQIVQLLTEILAYAA